MGAVKSRMSKVLENEVAVDPEISCLEFLILAFHVPGCRHLFHAR